MYSDNVLTPEECKEVVDYAQEDIEESLVIQGKSTPRKSDIRKSKTSFISPGSLVDHLMEKVLDTFFSIAKNGFRLPLGGAESIQYAEYGPDNYYGWHVDPGPTYEHDRDISASLILSAPDEYQGGSLEFQDLELPEEKQGRLIVFPSMIRHQVSPIKKGNRKSLVIWGVRESA